MHRSLQGCIDCRVSFFYGRKEADTCGRRCIAAT